MFERDIKAELEKGLQQYPVVTVMGPRQSGKTTLLKMYYPDRIYYNLEDPDVRSRIQADPKSFFNQLDLQRGIILDEIQRAPDLLSYIQVKVDEERVAGSIIITGSHQLQLHQAISQSLAGRTAILELLPLSMGELTLANIHLTVDEYLLNGFFPAIYQHKIDPVMAARNYIKTYVERDVRQLVNVRDLDSFQRFIKLSAGRVGSIINRESLAADVGVSQNTIKNWTASLEVSYLGYQLQPYYENFGKRLIKSPKFYFTDVGLATYLLDIKSTVQLANDKMRGHLFENMVINECLKNQFNKGREANFYFYRDSNQNEVDLLIQIRDKLIPIEIKSTATFSPSLLRGIKNFQKIAKDRAPIGVLIYAGDTDQTIGNIELISFKNIARLHQIIG